MKRRDFVTLAAATLGQAGAGDLWAQAGAAAAMDMGGSDPGPHAAPADFTLRIAPIAVEIAPSHFVSTVGYNGTSPGPVLRMREGRPVTVDVINDSGAPELVHWHGLFLPSEIDGAEEEGSLAVAPG